MLCLRSLNNVGINRNTMYWLLVVTFLCLRTNVDAQSSGESGAGVLSRKATRCQTKDEQPGFCLPVVRCRKIMSSIRRFRNPKICYTENEVTYICCPVRPRHTPTPANPKPVPAIPPTRRSPPKPTPTPGIVRKPPIASTNGRPSGVDLNPPGCGIRAYMPAKGSGFIVGGKEAEKHSWPWMAAIRIKSFGQNTNFLCGGSLITKRHVLTAAHCFGQGLRAPADYRVILGSHYRSSGRDSTFDEEILKVTPSYIKIHEEYKDSEHDYDVAVMTLDTDVPFTAEVTPVCLPSRPNQRREPGHVRVIGWGDTEFGGVGSSTLQEVDFPVVPLNRCRQIFQQVPDFVKGITSGMLCAGDLKGEKDSCQNDSGGPLMEENVAENKWTQIGIVSFGYKCAERGFPGVYSRVASFIPWIQKNVRRAP